MSSAQDMASALYEGTPLPPTAMHIRLLELQPLQEPDVPIIGATGSTDATPLRCRIFSAPIDGASFQALSYAWGPGGQTHKLLVTTIASEVDTDEYLYSIPITESLDEALRHLRHNTERMTLWVDQICIDQSNTEEKTRQVALMAQIYTQASQVLVWLGPSTPQSDRLMDVWSSIGQQARDWGLESYYTAERYPLLKQIASGIVSEELSGLTVSFRGLCERTALCFLGKSSFEEADDLTIFDSITQWYQRPWFSRVWVMQEFALSQRPIFIWGNKRVEARLVLLTKQLLDRSNTISLILYRDGEKMEVPAPDATIAAFDQVYFDTTQTFFTAASRRKKLNGDNGPGDTLLQLLIRMYASRYGQKFMSGDPRDRIYGLLGLAIDTKVLGITPDYSQSVTADLVYTKVTRSIIRQQSKELDDEFALDILGLVHFPKRGPRDVVEALPTWVPDWSQLRQSFCARNHSSIKQPEFFTASGDNRNAHMLVTTADNILGLEGFTVDEVAEVGIPWLGASHDDHISHLKMLREIQRLYNISTEMLALKGLDTSIDFSKQAEAVWRVPIGDIEAVDNEWRRATEHCSVAYSFLLEKIKPSGLIEPAGEDHEEFWKSFRHANPSAYTMRMREMQNMCPYVTRNRGFVGMGPIDLKPGDLVVIFYGAQVPHIIRQSDQPRTFSFLGETYCHGIMDGEILATASEPEAFYLQ